MIVMVSGGFDPLHVGHINLIEGAAEYGKVVAVVNSDDWLMRKKGFVVMPWHDRARIIKALKLVDMIVECDDSDDTVRLAIESIRPHYFANGGDRTEGHPDEATACDLFGVRQLFNIGGGKVRSSSEIVKGPA